MPQKTHLRRLLSGALIAIVATALAAGFLGGAAMADEPVVDQPVAVGQPVTTPAEQPTTVGDAGEAAVPSDTPGEPVATDPVTTEPVTTEPVTTDPAARPATPVLIDDRGVRHVDAGPENNKITSAGTDFWVAFNSIGQVNTVPLPTMNLYITGTPGTTGTAKAEGVPDWKHFTIGPDGSATVIMDPTVRARYYDDRLWWWAVDRIKTVPAGNGAPGYMVPTAVHIETSANVTVQVHNRPSGDAEGYLALPTQALGTDYMVLDRTVENDIPATEYRAYMGKLSIVAPADNTHVVVVPKPGTGLKPFGLTLSKWQVYELEIGAQDLATWPTSGFTGTNITSDQPVAVFTATESPLAVEQMVPINTWGKNFVTYPLTTGNEQIYRVVAIKDGTQVSINTAGATQTQTLSAGQFYEWRSTQAMSITATQPVQVAQFVNLRGFEPPANSSPWMSLIYPVEQGFTDSAWITPVNSGPNWDTDTYHWGGILTNYVNVTAPTANTSDVRLDGNPVGGWSAIPGSSYSGTTVQVSANSVHRLTSPVPIVAVAYGNAGYTGYPTPNGYGWPVGWGIATAPRHFSAEKSTFTISPEPDPYDRSTWVPADGVSSYTLTVTARDTDGELMKELDLAGFTFSCQNKAITITGVVNNGDGTYSAQATSTQMVFFATVLVTYREKEDNPQVGRTLPILFSL